MPKKPLFDLGKKPPPEIDPLIDFWNQNPFVRSHKNTQSKVYLECMKRLSETKNGKLNNYPIDEEWMVRTSLPLDWLTECWTDEIILTALLNLRKAFNKHCWPANKKSLPDNFPNFVYNERTNKSWLVIFRANAPENFRKRRTYPEWVEDEFGIELVKMFQEICYEISGTPLQENETIWLLDSIRTYWFENLTSKTEDPTCNTFLGDPNIFAEQYAHFLVNRFSRFPNLDISIIKIDSKTWNKFIYFLQKEFGFDETWNSTIFSLKDLEL